METPCLHRGSEPFPTVMIRFVISFPALPDVVPYVCHAFFFWLLDSMLFRNPLPLRTLHLHRPCHYSSQFPAVAKSPLCNLPPLPFNDSFATQLPVTTRCRSSRSSRGAAAKETPADGSATTAVPVRSSTVLPATTSPTPTPTQPPTAAGCHWTRVTRPRGLRRWSTARVTPAGRFSSVAIQSVMPWLRSRRHESRTKAATTVPICTARGSVGGHTGSATGRRVFTRGFPPSVGWCCPPARTMRTPCATSVCWPGAGTCRKDGVLLEYYFAVRRTRTRSSSRAFSVWGKCRTSAGQICYRPRWAPSCTRNC